MGFNGGFGGRDGRGFGGNADGNGFGGNQGGNNFGGNFGGNGFGGNSGGNGFGGNSGGSGFGGNSGGSGFGGNGFRGNMGSNGFGSNMGGFNSNRQRGGTSGMTDSQVEAMEIMAGLSHLTGSRIQPGQEALATIVAQMLPEHMQDMLANIGTMNQRRNNNNNRMGGFNSQGGHSARAEQIRMRQVQRYFGPNSMLARAVRSIVHPNATPTRAMINVAMGHQGPPSTRAMMMEYIPHMVNLAFDMRVSPDGVVGRPTRHQMEDFIVRRGMNWMDGMGMGSSPNTGRQTNSGTRPGPSAQRTNSPVTSTPTSINTTTKPTDAPILDEVLQLALAMTQRAANVSTSEPTGQVNSKTSTASTSGSSNAESAATNTEKSPASSPIATATGQSVPISLSRLRKRSMSTPKPQVTRSPAVFGLLG